MSVIMNHQQPAKAPPRRIVNAAASGTYLGEDLRDSTGRPGAMDAYRLPSLINGRLAPSPYTQHQDRIGRTVATDMHGLPA